MTDAINPKHYQFPGGVQTIDITENLNGNGAQGTEYFVRSTRLDGNNKHDTTEGLIEDLRKAIWFAEREIKRLGGTTNDAPIYVTAEELGLRKPRVWDSIESIPTYVTAVDRQGDFWRPIMSGLGFRYKEDPEFDDWDFSITAANQFAPFTEVLSV